MDDLTDQALFTKALPHSKCCHYNTDDQSFDITLKCKFVRLHICHSFWLKMYTGEVWPRMSQSRSGSKKGDNLFVPPLCPQKVTVQCILELSRLFSREPGQCWSLLPPTCSQTLQRTLSQQSGDKVLGISWQSILPVWPDDVIWTKHIPVIQSRNVNLSFYRPGDWKLIT